MNTPKMPKFVTKIQTWLVIVTAIAGTYAGAAALGLQVPRPTWISEHLQLAGEVKQNTIKALKSDVSHIRRQLIDARIAKTKVKKGTLVYDKFLEDEQQLKDQLDDAKEALNRARRKK